MIISNKQIQSVLKVYSEQNNAVKNAKTEKTQPAKGQDQVILSTGVQEFGQVLQRAVAMSDVRPERVKELSKKIQAGTYQVDSKDVADKMIGRTLVDRLL
jgi:negative regulator of flagellin synthesis FlgM